MELHELESAWKALDARVAQQDLEIANLRAQGALARMRGTLARASRGQWVQLGIGLLFAVWGGGFWVDHLGTPHLVAYGMAVHAYGIALLATAIALLVALAAVDYALPVSEVQSRLLRLRRTRIRTERVLWIAGALIWVPVLMLVARAVGVDAWAINPAYVLGNLAVGLAIAAVVAWATWWKPAWFARRAMAGALEDVERQLADVESLRS